MMGEVWLGREKGEENAIENYMSKLMLWDEFVEGRNMELINPCENGKC